MALSEKDKQEVKERLSESERYIVQMISGDRKANAIYQRNLDHEIMRLNNSNETILLKIEQLVEAAKIDKCATCANGQSIKEYQKKMKPYELMMEWKRVPFYTACILFIGLVWEKLPQVWEMIKSKIL